ncbi:hypothetical protein HPP92_026054 [Vanilla planifolia]|uniref:Uncharacterized protein n=1 Tax=Vanilla planifolia TaxID=51239 RepID=A0A835UA44_VANPL|nr:hypothetical protein HPP92_026054 [Vanilla planifolia]
MVFGGDSHGNCCVDWLKEEILGKYGCCKGGSFVMIASWKFQFFKAYSFKRSSSFSKVSHCCSQCALPYLEGLQLLQLQEAVSLPFYHQDHPCFSEVSKLLKCTILQKKRFSSETNAKYAFRFLQNS